MALIMKVIDTCGIQFHPLNQSERMLTNNAKQISNTRQVYLENISEKNHEGQSAILTIMESHNIVNIISRLRLPVDIGIFDVHE